MCCFWGYGSSGSHWSGRTRPTQPSMSSQNLAIKLSTLVAKGDSNHPYMRKFPYRDLLEKVQVYLDSFLAEHPSDFLLKVTGWVPPSVAVVVC